MIHGLEVVPLNDYMMVESDKAHRQNARIVQNLSNMTQKPSTLANIGRLTMKPYITIRKMAFFWSIPDLLGTDIYKIVIVLIIKLHDRHDVKSSESPMSSMCQMICKYKLTDFFMSCVRANHVRELGDINW